MRLYVSSDFGETWRIDSDQLLPVTKLDFEATADGEYWFAHATDLITITDPAKQLKPERKVIIDTVGPEIDLSATSERSGKVTATVKLKDDRGIKALRVLYATDVVRDWKTIPNASLDKEGRFTIEPKEDWRELSIHVTATDTLGHHSVEARRFRRPRLAGLPKPRLAGGPIPSDPAGPNQLRQPTRPPFESLRAQTVAGPGDPPSFRFQPPTVAPAQPKPTSTQPTPSIATPTTNDRPTAAQRFQTPSAARVPVQTTPQTLPAAGMAARMTSTGIEVLPPPAPDESSEVAEVLPTPTPATELNPPHTAASIGNSEPSMVPYPAPPITRALDSAAKPSLPSTNASTTDLETIPTPAPSRTPSQTPGQTPSQTPGELRRYRAERAEQTARKSQQEFDRAALLRTVPYRFSDSNQFSLEYELEAVGSSGVESVELYGSTDGGETWKRWGADPDSQSPFDIETKGEGLFAFRIVVIGNNGLQSPRPLPGDKPDIAVIVDQTLPDVKITSARYGEGDRVGSLVIRYECNDEHLTRRPVAIAFSDSLEGPWTTIASGLQNEGLYVWPADPRLPPSIYLRVDVIDQAGNRGSHLLDQPIATGGLAPRARILGFRSR